MYIPDEYDEFIMELTVKYGVEIVCYTSIKREERKELFEIYYERLPCGVASGDKTHYIIWISESMNKGFLRIGTYDEITQIAHLSDLDNKVNDGVPELEKMTDTSECVTKEQFIAMWFGKKVDK